MQEADSVKTLVRQARNNYLAGQALEAVNDQIKVVNQLVSEGKENIQEIKILSLYLYNLGDLCSAVKVLQSIKNKAIKDPEIIENLGVLLLKSGKPQEAILELKEAAILNPDKPNIHDALARAYGQLANMEKCLHHGETSLLLKDQAAATIGKSYPLPNKAPSPFSWDTPSQNIISYSLWGNNPRYLKGALRNATLAPDIYPGWRCRFYCDDTVPENTRNILQEKGAEIIMMPRPQNFFDGLIWRFLVADDSKIRRFLVRDCDSVINLKERVAVDEWLESDYYFHIMRDYYSHTEVILAGMWGGVGGILPPIQSLLNQFHPNTFATSTYDQVFLREAVWPTVRQSCLIHDRFFRVLNAKEFPPYGKLPPNKHIGQNEWIFRKNNLGKYSKQLIIS